jgi:hypothetical protein
MESNDKITESGWKNPAAQINSIQKYLISRWDSMDTENNSITHRGLLNVLQELQFWRYKMQMGYLHYVSITMIWIRSKSLYIGTTQMPYLGLSYDLISIWYVKNILSEEYLLLGYDAV